MLELWETAAAAVLQREAILEQLLQLQAAVFQCRQSQQQLQQQDSQLYKQRSVTYEALETSSQQALFGLSVQQVRQLLWAFLAATQQVQQAGQDLQDVTGQELLVDGCPYPPTGADVSLEQLQHLLTEAWHLLGSGRA